MQGIYKITNTENGQVYIGRSTDIENRWKQHQEALESCRVCIYYDENSLNSGYTKECSSCGFYPWTSDDLPLKYKYCKE